MTDKKPVRKNIATTVDEELFDQLHDIRFEKRHDRISDTFRAALNEYVARHGSVKTGAATGSKR